MWVRQDGQATVEFALVLPILILVLVAIVQFGVTYSHYISLTDAVRTAARAAAVNGGSQAAAQAAADQSAGSGAVRIQAQSDGTSVRVTGSRSYSIDIFGITPLAGDLTSTTTERIE